MTSNMLTAVPYTPAHAPIWDDFVKRSRNATFLHMRDYMDYHRDRFSDASLLLYDEKDKLAALLPANSSGERICSHGGLTYGGLLIDDRTNVMTVCDAFEAIIRHYSALGYKELLYKAIPTIYDKLPAQEDRYALFLNRAEMAATNIASTVPLSTAPSYNENTRRNIRKALKNGISVTESDDIESFYGILSELLASRYDAVPVHSLVEIKRLASLFPDNIRLMLAMKDGIPVGGALLYITDTVAHTQYIAANEMGKECDALSLLFDNAITMATAQGKRFFDFGTCNEQGGLYLNTGLIRQKNGFGGRGIVYPSYRIGL